MYGDTAQGKMVIKLKLINYRDGNKWFARPILEGKDETWKAEILCLVTEVKYIGICEAKRCSQNLCKNCVL